MRYIALRDLSLCPVDAAQTIVWRDEPASSAYLSAQQARHRADPDDLLVRAIYSICLGLKRSGGEATAGECWDGYRMDLRRTGDKLDWSQGLAFIAAWNAVRFMAQHSVPRAQQVISRSSVSDTVMLQLRARTLPEPASRSDALRQLVTSFVVSLLETPNGNGSITKDAVFQACVLALREDYTQDGGSIRQAVTEFIDEVWQELDPHS